MPATTLTPGPGILKLGPTASALDVSCQVVSALVDPTIDVADSIPVLCGDIVGGEETVTWTLKCTFVQDNLKTSGLTAWTWNNAGKPMAFEYTPNTAGAAKIAGTVIVRPIAVGGEARKKAQQDTEWTIVGAPTPTWGTGA